MVDKYSDLRAISCGLEVVPSNRHSDPWNETADALRHRTLLIASGHRVAPSVSSGGKRVSDELSELNQRFRHIADELNEMYSPTSTDTDGAAEKRDPPADGHDISEQMQDEEQADTDTVCDAFNREQLQARAFAARRKDTPVAHFVPEDVPPNAVELVAPRSLAGPFFSTAPSTQDRVLARMISGDSMDQNTRNGMISELLRVGANRELLATADLSGPVKDVHARAYEDSILREPMPGSGERPCLNDHNCIGYRKLGDVLVECLSTAENIALHETGQRPRERRQCLRCRRDFASRVYHSARANGYSQGASPNLVTFRNLPDFPGEYSMSQCLWLPKLMAPVLFEMPRCYRRVHNRAEGIYYHVQDGYFKPPGFPQGQQP